MTPTATGAVGERASPAARRVFCCHDAGRDKETSMGFLVVFLGGGIGAALRHGVNLAVARVLGSGFNYATLFENVSGSLVMGLLVGYFTFKGTIPQHWRLFLTTGILGGYTTFSAFSLDTILLYERGELGLAALYVIASVALSIGGLLAGLFLIRHFA
jgi:fluoride exporter